jgi:Zn-dependent protease
MTLAFLLSSLGGIGGIGFYDARGILILLAASFVAVVTAFLLHELAHKVIAQRYGCFAEFRYSLMGLAIGLLTGAFGLLFALPGAVMISGSVNERQTVRISAAGPGTNLAVAGVFTAISFALGSSTSSTAGLASVLVGMVAFVNLFLGFFNLLPFPPLDGSRIFSINKPLWVAMLVGVGVVYLSGNFLKVPFF